MKLPTNGKFGNDSWSWDNAGNWVVKLIDDSHPALAHLKFVRGKQTHTGFMTADTMEKLGKRLIELAKEVRRREPK